MESVDHKAQFLCGISRTVGSGNLVAFNVLDNKEVIFAVTQKGLDYREETAGGSFAVVKPEVTQNYSVFISSLGQVIHVTNIIGERYNIHHIQPLSKDRLLLVSSRSYYSSSKSDHNGRIYGMDGIYQNETLLGDGIANVQVAPDGTIWTGYFDEGIYGNFGWKNPLGRSGLVAWNDKGEKQYEYSPLEELDTIDSCYALNVESEFTTWCYYYSAFPLVKIEQGKMSNYWRMPLEGGRAFAIYRNFALFAKGYNKDGFLFLIELLDNHVAKFIKKIRLKNIDKIECVTAKGDSLFILEGSGHKRVYRISVGEFL